MEWTEDGHLIGENGWILPANAQEFMERYPNRVVWWAKKFGRDNWEDVAQSGWLALFRRPSVNSRYPQAKDTIDYANHRFMETGKVNEDQFLAYIRGVIQAVARKAEGTNSADALDTDVMSIEFETETPDSLTFERTAEEWLFEKRNRQREQMQNAPDRVLLLQQFLAFVEKHDPDLIPFILAIEDAKLGRSGSFICGRVRNVGKVLGLSKEESDECGRRLTAMAERFEGKPLSGEIRFFLNKDYVSRLRSRGRRLNIYVKRDRPPKDELLHVVAEKTFAEAGIHYRVDAMLVRDWALSYGFTRFAGKIVEPTPERLQHLIDVRRKYDRGYFAEPKKKKVEVKVPKKRGRPRKHKAMESKQFYGMHIRWHVNRGKPKDGCIWCKAAISACTGSESQPQSPDDVR